MIKIGMPSVTLSEGRARLWAEVETDGRAQTVWFEVDACYADCLSGHCADPFVMLTLPEAIRVGKTIWCDTPVTERLQYQLEQYLIPALCAEGAAGAQLCAPIFGERMASRGAVGTVWCGDEGDIREQMRVGADSGYPLSHLLVFGPEDAAVPGLEVVRMDTNAEEVPRRFLELAGMLALQGLFSVCLLPFREEVPADSPVPSAMAYHLLLTQCASLDTLAFYLYGMEQTGVDKPVKSVPPIRVGPPHIEVREGMCRLQADVEVDGEQRVLWFEVEEEYGEYLVVDRADAFVVGLLPTAMARGADIVSQAPVTKRLIHQLNAFLIPTLTSHIARWNPMTIHGAATEKLLPCKGAVATGWTAGTDSFYTLMKHLELPQKSRQLTHLLIASHGAIEGGDSTKTLWKMVDKARGFAQGKGLSVIGVDSNVQTFDTEGFGDVGSFRSGAVGLALQKLLGTFLHSSDYAFSRFNFDKHGDGYYQLLNLGYLESDATVFYSAGGAVSKTAKTRALAEYPLAYDKLHPCVFATRANCGRCAKCMWTEVALYVFGRLEAFDAVFDVEDFYANKELFLTSIVRDKHLTSYQDILKVMQEKDIEQEFITKTDRILQRINRAKKKQKLWLMQRQAEGRRQESEKENG